GEQSEQQPAEHASGRTGPLEVMREARKDGAVERERRQQARERWAERGGEAREQQHDRGRHDEPRRDVPPWPPCGASALRISRHEDERHDDRADHERQERDQRQGQELQRDGRRAEPQAAGEERQGPATAARPAAVEHTEHGLRGGAGHGADGRARGERHALVEGQEERNGTRRERKSDEPAADPRSPPPTGQADRADQSGGEHELERQTVHDSEAYRDRAEGGSFEANGALSERGRGGALARDAQNEAPTLVAELDALFLDLFDPEAAIDRVAFAVPAPV